MKIVYREFQAEDLSRIKVITVAAFDGVSIDRNIDDVFGPNKLQSWQSRKSRHIDADLLRDEAKIFVATVDEMVVGYISTWIDRDAGQGFIPNLAVDEHWRGQGIGRNLMNRAIDHFRQRNLVQVRIETLDQNEVGQTLYPDMGFREVARQIHFCLNLNDDARPSAS